MQCAHKRRRLYRLIASNKAVQVREICLDCGRNARGDGINVPHSEVRNLNALPLLADNSPSTQATQGQLL